MTGSKLPKSQVDLNEPQISYKSLRAEHQLMINSLNCSEDSYFEESLTAEKCLLYVALTRAQETAYITSYGQQSGLII
jgi:superfamily I DNA/RNA helicase